MADDLRTHEAQLEMVEAALLSDSHNEELQQLKADLEEVIALTRDIIKTQDGDSKVSNFHGSSNNHDVAVSSLDPVIKDVGEDDYSTSEVVNKNNLRRIGTGPHRGNESKHEKDYNKEYLKRRKQKKQQRFKQMEEARESGKNKWLSFHAKAAKKPGVNTKSIFASPDNLTGRVGVGTCGISGKPMTDYTHCEKWKKGEKKR